MMDTPLSFYRRVSDSESQLTITLEDWLGGVRQARWRDVVEPTRREYAAHGKSARYSALKRRLPGVTPAGVFAARRITGLRAPSGILHGDIDNLSERRMGWARESLEADPHVVFCFVSPSGAGLKFGVSIAPATTDADYKSAFWGLAHYVRRKHGVELDSACQDISRACFVSFDPEIHLNPNPSLFTNRRAPPEATRKAVSPPPRGAFPLPRRNLNEPTRAAAQALFERAVRRLKAAPEGGRHEIRLSAGALVGGLLAGGVLPQSAAEELVSTALAHSNDPGDAERSIRDALRFGAERPITPEHRILKRELKYSRTK